MRKTVIAIALSLACTHVMAEKLYKWVDENGVTQFSQQPPASNQYERMTVTPPPELGSVAAPTTQPEANGSAADAEDNAATDQQAEREQQALRDAQCAKLREDLKTMETNPRLARTNAEGEMVRLGEEERQAMMTTAREQLGTYCN